MNQSVYPSVTAYLKNLYETINCPCVSPEIVICPSIPGIFLVEYIEFKYLLLLAGNHSDCLF